MKKKSQTNKKFLTLKIFSFSSWDVFFIFASLDFLIKSQKWSKNKNFLSGNFNQWLRARRGGDEAIAVADSFGLDIQDRRPVSINPVTNLPYYCDEPPQLIPPSPEAGEELQVTGSISIDLRAMYYQNLSVHYDLKRFQYNSPQVNLFLKTSDLNPQAPVAQKIADEVVFRHFQGERVEFFF